MVGERIGGVLRPRFKKLLLDVLLDAGFQTADFFWQEGEPDEKGIESHTLILRDDEKFFFSIRVLNNVPKAMAYWPNQSFREGRAAIIPESVDEQDREISDCFYRWILQVKAESVPDPWEDIRNYRQIALPPSRWPADNRTFDPPEIERVEAAIETIKELLLDEIRNRAGEKGIQAQHTAFVEESLDFLVENARKQGRRAFIQQAFGVFLQIWLTIGLQGPVFQTVCQILLAAVQDVRKLIP